MGVTEWFELLNEVGAPYAVAALFAYIAYRKDKRVDTVTDRHREDAVAFAKAMENSANALRESNTTSRDLLSEIRNRGS